MSDTTRDPRPQQRSNPYDDPIAAREFRRYCQRLVRLLPIPAPFDEWVFCDALAKQRGRPIILKAWPIRQEISGDDIVSGFVQVEKDCDLIFYERDTRRLHQQQIVAHEGAHLILGHQGESITSDDLITQLSLIAPRMTIRHVHRRAGAHTPEEFEAETLGRAILRHAYSTSAQLARHYPQAAPLLDLLEGLEGRDG